jgi:hypothetical protein
VEVFATLTLANLDLALVSTLSVDEFIVNGPKGEDCAFTAG